MWHCFQVKENFSILFSDLPWSKLGHGSVMGEVWESLRAALSWYRLLTCFVSPAKTEEWPGQPGWLGTSWLPSEALFLPEEQWGFRPVLRSVISQRRAEKSSPSTSDSGCRYLRPGNEQSLNCISWILLSFSFTPLSLELAYLFHKGKDISWPFSFPSVFQVWSPSIIISLYTNTHRCLRN